MRIGLLGVPFNGDGTRPEEENPAAVLRRAGLTGLRWRDGATSCDYGDVDIPVFDGKRDPATRVLNLGAWQELSRRTATRLTAIQAETDFVVVLGGDCAILVGIFGAIRSAGRRVGLVSLDGHTDFRDPGASPSGEPADLELAILTGRGPAELTGLFGPPPMVRPEDVVVCGYREPDMIAASTIARLDRQVFREIGAENAAHRALSTLGHLDRLWLHFDVDVIDPTLVPVYFPEPDGLDIDDTRAFLSAALGSGKFIGMSVACYHPRLDPSSTVAARIAGLLGAVLAG